jgi:hypothetical protein
MKCFLVAFSLSLTSLFLFSTHAFHFHFLVHTCPPYDAIFATGSLPTHYNLTLYIYTKSTPALSVCDVESKR